jgi:hypothetical protein
VQQESSGSWTSADGRWRWDGQAWVPNDPGRWPAARLAFEDVLSLPTRDPGWLGKCAIEGLIAFIPIYGSFELLGWVLTYLDHLRAGRSDLPPAHFGYAGRGAAPAVVWLLWGLVVLVIVYGTLGATIAAMIASTPRCSSSTDCSTNPPAPFAAFGFLGIFGIEALIFAGYLVALFLVLPVILRSERFGIGAGLNLVAAFRMARGHFATSAAAAGMIFLIGFIAGLGVYACIVGAIFTYGYGAAMLGVALRWYEERVPVLPDG